MHLEAAGRALARKKEEVVFLEFSRHGHVVFDNSLGGSWNAQADGQGAGTPVGTGYYIPNASGLASTGRGFDGNFNGTLTAQDFIDMCTSIMAAGFTPTDVIMHPLCWSLFVGNENLMGLFSSNVAAFGGGFQSQAVIPQIPASRPYQLPVAGLSLSFSPYVPFDEVNKTFDIYIIDRNNAGVLLVKDSISIEQFEDPARDIQALKVRERYGCGVLNGGLGIAVAKGIRFAKTYPMPGREFAALAMPADMTNANMDKIQTPRV